MPSLVLLAAFLVGFVVAAVAGAVFHARARASWVRTNEKTMSRLRRAQSDLEGDLSSRTRELRMAQARAEGLSSQMTTTATRFERALRGSSVTAFTLDKSLKVTWSSRAERDRAEKDREEKNVARAGDQAAAMEAGDPSDLGDPKVLELKRQVLENGQPARMEFAAPSERWYELELDALREGDQVVGLIGVLVDITEQRDRENRIQLLLREVTHRSKNLLAVIQSMARQTAAHSADTRDFSKVFSQRIQSLAVSHDLLLKADWHGADIHRVVEAQVAPFEDRIGERIRIGGPALSLRPEAAQSLGMAIHELVTNAAKFGALSVPSGTVEVAWKVADRQDNEAALEFEWRERGNPSATTERRRGFGHVVLESATARALAGRSLFSYAQDGVTWTLVISAKDWVQETQQRRAQRG